LSQRDKGAKVNNYPFYTAPEKLFYYFTCRDHSFFKKSGRWFLFFVFFANHLTNSKL